MSRSIWKNPHVSSYFLKISKLDGSIIVKNRSLCVPGSFVGKKVKIYNGKELKSVIITREKVGYKFGEFCLTRQRTLHSIKKKNKKK